MKKLLTFWTILSLSTLAKEPQTPEAQATDFIRVQRNENHTLLQPAIATYQKNDVHVTLLGAVHIADKAYYTDLNTRFKKYDRVLFEMIGGDKIAEIKKAEAEGQQLKNSPVASMQKMASSFLKLTDQKTEIDYTAKNFVHADLTMAEFEKLQEKRGESLLDFALEAAKNADTSDNPSALSLMSALMSGDADKAKLLLIDALAGGDEAMGGLMDPSVIITDRNAKALQVLDAQIKAGHKKLGIFYGAGHFPDMEKSLLKQGYKKTKQEWLTAWSVKKN